MMKIELNYDPVRPETMVCIDGQMTDRSDIYGFLYPVRHCLLQTWIYPSGSWSGLDWQLRELSRGEEIELTFVGRSEDFEDIQSALADMERLTLRLRQEDPLSAYGSLFSRMEEQLDLLLDEQTAPGEKKRLSDLFPETAAEIRSVRCEVPQVWYQVISSEADYVQADQRELCCCIVGDTYLDSYEKLEKVNRLTRSMRRSQDMICCCMDDPQQQADFAHYAAQYENLRIRFETQERILPVLQRKYGDAYALRFRLRQYARILSLLRECYGKRDYIKSRRTQLAEERNRTLEQIRELEHCKVLLNWFSRKEPYLVRLETLLADGIEWDAQGKE